MGTVNDTITFLTLVLNKYLYRANYTFNQPSTEAFVGYLNSLRGLELSIASKHPKTKQKCKLKWHSISQIVPLNPD